MEPIKNTYIATITKEFMLSLIAESYSDNERPYLGVRDFYKDINDYGTCLIRTCFTIERVYLWYKEINELTNTISDERMEFICLFD